MKKELLDSWMARMLMKAELKYAMTMSGELCVERILISLMALLLAKHLV